MRRFPVKKSRLVLSTLGLVSLMLASVSSKAVHAQTAQQPVARLVSSSLDSRTRRPAIAEIKSTALTAPDNTSSNLEEASSIERRAFEETNVVRAKYGLPPLVWDSQLYKLARTHSEGMARLKFFGHVTPDGFRLQDRARSEGVRYQVIAENIAYNKGYDDPGAFAVERWMLSPGHRANILYTGFTAMAVGTFVTADGTVYLTQTFITR